MIISEVIQKFRSLYKKIILYYKIGPKRIIESLNVFFQTHIKNIKRYFLNRRLTTKFIILYILLIAIPVTLLSLYTFNSLESAAKSQLKLSLKHSMEIAISDIQLNIDSIDKISRITTDKTNFKQFITENEKINTRDLIFFYNYFVNDMENIQNINPKIYSYRIFLENKDYLEQWPIIYNQERLKGLTWPNELLQNPNRIIWNTNISELIIPESNNQRKPKDLIALYKELKYGNIHLGYIEATMEMSVFFSQMYNSANPSQFMMVLDKKNNKIYFNKEKEFLFKSENIEVFLNKIIQNIESDNGEFKTTVWGQQIFGAYQYINQMDTYFINLVLTKPTIDSLRDQRNIFIFFALLLVIILCFFTYKIVYILLKNLSIIIEAIRKVSTGNLDTRIKVKGKDEVAELAENLNTMLNRIKELMQVQLKNQEVTKNAEIKALQTQINAHFIHNTLESIRMMAEIDNQFEISDSITALGRLIRYGMNWKSPLVHLNQELEYVQNYVKLLNIRHDYKIVLLIKIEEYILNYKILKMTVQPIIENAIKYGINPFQNDAVIRISGVVENDIVVIEISDSGIGISKERLELLNKNIINGVDEISSETGGIGLRNISERIKFFYGQKYGIEILSKENCFTKVRMILPLQSKEGGILYENITNS